VLSCKRWRTRIELTNAMFEYLEICHSRRRRHSSLGWLSPQEFENQTKSSWPSFQQPDSTEPGAIPKSEPRALHEPSSANRPACSSAPAVTSPPPRPVPGERSATTPHTQRPHRRPPGCSRRLPGPAAPATAPSPDPSTHRCRAWVNDRRGQAARHRPAGASATTTPPTRRTPADLDSLHRPVFHRRTKHPACRERTLPSDLLDNYLDCLRAGPPHGQDRDSDSRPINTSTGSDNTPENI
jgi:hypothetical protein